MTHRFTLVSVQDFERMTRAEKDEYIQKITAHLRAIKGSAIGESLSLPSAESSQTEASAYAAIKDARKDGLAS